MHIHCSIVELLHIIIIMRIYTDGDYSIIVKANEQKL